MSLGLIIAKRKSGNEDFINKGKSIGTTMLDFWQWAYSDTMGNAERGKIAEFIVAQAVGIPVKNSDNLSDPWGKFDLESPNGIKIEVKASGYIQSWAQEYESKLIFGISETLGWDALTSKFEEEKKRQSDVYVFCVFKHKEAETLNPLQLEQWDFYVISTKILNEKVKMQKSISLNKLIKIGAIKTDFESLGVIVKKETKR